MAATGHVRADYFAAMGHLALQRDAAAVIHLQRYLAADLKAEPVRNVEVARIKLAQAQGRMGRVILRLAPPPAANEVIKIEARRTDGGNTERLAVDLAQLASTDRGPALWLSPGAWTLTFTRAGYAPLEHKLELPAGTTQEPTLQLLVLPPPTPTPAPTPVAPPTTAHQPVRDTPLAIGTLAVGGVAAATGAVVLTIGVSRYRRVASCDGDIGMCKVDLAVALRIRDAGAGVLGAGLGVVAGGLVWLAPAANTRRNAWIAGTALGAATAAGGFAWLLVSSRQLNIANTTPVDDWMVHYAGPGRAPAHAASSAVFGLGTGLAVASVAGLLNQHLSRRATRLSAVYLRGWSTFRSAGLSVMGTF